ncbi:BNIP2 [Lepeophtheirus salmonis]|uniref:BNIP2 n=1 Tax=Lepeophtheirus salmonis TaxID=72036 RepID=A0A7R8HBK4_LEPSM|nr:BNIP2 [Lepeophtheirus salmonis]CAF2988805.1 BNIP2 [Lepeophtheirus salmonis]
MSSEHKEFLAFGFSIVYFSSLLVDYDVILTDLFKQTRGDCIAVAQTSPSAIDLEGLDQQSQEVNMIEDINVPNDRSTSPVGVESKTSYQYHTKKLNGTFAVPRQLKLFKFPNVRKREEIVLETYLRVAESKYQLDRCSQFEVERICKSVLVIDDDQIQAKVNDYCDKIGLRLKRMLTMPILQTSLTSSNSASNSINIQIDNLNSYMKSMIVEEFQILFESKIIHQNIEISRCRGYIRTTLADPSSNRNCQEPKQDFQLGLPNSKKSTATMKHSFSAMTKLRSKLTTDRLCISLNKDFIPRLDIDALIDSWLQKQTED